MALPVQRIDADRLCMAFKAISLFRLLWQMARSSARFAPSIAALRALKNPETIWTFKLFAELIASHLDAFDNSPRPRPVLGSTLSSNRIGKVMSGTSNKAARVANKAIGKAKQGIGGAVGSDKMKAEGAVQEAKGDVQKAVGDAKNATKEAVDKTADAIKKPL